VRISPALASIGLTIVTACSPRIKTLSAVVTPTLPVVAHLHPATVDANARVEVTIAARVRNTSQDTLRIAYGCDDPPMTLDYLANKRWYWYVDQYLVNACAVPYTELTLAPGDSAVLRPTLRAKTAWSGRGRVDRAIAWSISDQDWSLRLLS
jgi:hypothetical protein